MKQDMSTLTHKERLRLAKEQRNREEFERMKNAAQEATLNKSQAKLQMYNQFHANSSYKMGTI